MYKIMTIHQPVLLNEVIQYFNPQSNQNFIDCTIGGGGHAFQILSLTNPEGKLMGIDWSKEAIEELKEESQKLKINNRLILVNDNFINLKKIVKEKKFYPLHGILFDLGLSSDLLEKSGRGFSFQKDEILDMRLNPEKQILTAEKILNQASEKNLIDIFKNFGEERFAKLITKKIIWFRKKEKIQSTFQLVNLIKIALGRKFQKKSLSRIFQALRIAVNNELKNLEQVLPQAVEILETGGRLIIISYHSLEDRIVKNFFKNNLQLKILTKKPIRPSQEEIRNNPRARSAKLRAAEKIINNQFAPLDIF
ncbi:MAG: 16S rRNA (cytosine(1402)-N(4))-methyltransferase RsmH [Minisyncoccia bacterium]